MTLTLGLIFFIYGLVFGSFFNVVGLRVPNDSLFTQKRSYCDVCNRTLTWQELIPVFSFVKQKGKCSTCQSSISLLYPVMELGTALLFLLTYLVYGISWHTLFGLLLISLVMSVTVSDWVYQKIPNKLLIFYTPLVILYRLFFPLAPYWTSVVGAVFAFALVFLIILFSKGGMGVGDLKYYTFFGFVFGFSQFLLLFLLSTIYGTLYGLSMMLLNKATRKSRIPFGPFIGFAALTVYFFGNSIIQWYLNFLL
ncbi:A24 family peptidase [Alkalibacterium iburiense]|uniref:A24 family peptidase n=1 Tax=Alkalibacterium iburiense TaxID=290589 RepID=A0ABN0XE82_9LACT